MLSNDHTERRRTVATISSRHRSHSKRWLPNSVNVAIALGHVVDSHCLAPHNASLVATFVVVVPRHHRV